MGDVVLTLENSSDLTYGGDIPNDSDFFWNTKSVTYLKAFWEQMPLVSVWETESPSVRLSAGESASLIWDSTSSHLLDRGGGGWVRGGNSAHPSHGVIVRFT